MKSILVFGGSTSRTSINKKLAIYAASLLENESYTVLDLNDYKVPIYSVDEEINSGIPEAVEILNHQFDNASGFILSLAEHNGSYTAAFKNLIDWVSRKNVKIFRNKPVLLLATSPGGRGAISVLNNATTVFPHFGATVSGTFSLPKFNEHFSDGKLVQQEHLDTLKKLVLAFEKEI